MYYPPSQRVFMRTDVFAAIVLTDFLATTLISQ